MSKFSFDTLRSANIARCEDVFHEVKEWTPTDWACAMAGEAGEACNKVKKLRRLDGADKNILEMFPEKREMLADEIVEELADTVIYCDLLAARLNRDLSKAIIEKFNKVSKERGSKIFL